MQCHEGRNGCKAKPQKSTCGKRIALRTPLRSRVMHLIHAMSLATQRTQNELCVNGNQYWGGFGMMRRGGTRSIGQRACYRTHPDGFGASLSFWLSVHIKKQRAIQSSAESILKYCESCIMIHIIKKCIILKESLNMYERCFVPFSGHQPRGLDGRHVLRAGRALLLELALLRPPHRGE